MARLIFPSNFLAQQLLKTLFVKKHTVDGAASPVTPFLTERGITIASLEAASTQAILFNEQSKLLHQQSENYKKQRDLLFAPSFAGVKKSAQFLKRFFAEPHALADWFLTVDGKSRLVWPTDFLGQQQVAKEFWEKHLSFAPGASPLTAFLTENNLNATALLADAEAALLKNQTFVLAQGDAEEATKARDLVWAPAAANLLAIGNFLMGLFAKNQKKAADWGYVVDDSPRAPRLRVTTLKVGEQKTITSVLVGGTVENIGETSLHLYRGKTTVGTPTILEIGDAMGVLKGWSTITVVNPDGLKSGKVQMLVTAQ